MKPFHVHLSFRPLHFLILLLGGLMLLHLGLAVRAQLYTAHHAERDVLWDITTSGLGLTDLCIATEARYTRHPAVSDPVAPFMDHPEAIEHFPTGSFWAPPPGITGKKGPL